MWQLRAVDVARAGMAGLHAQPRSRTGTRRVRRARWLGRAAGVAALRVGAPGAFSGFVIVGPILVTGLYEISRLLARGERAGLGEAVEAWRRGTRPLVQLGMLLAVLGTLWVAASALLFTLFAPAPLRGPAEFLRYAVVEQGDLLFTLWAILGGLGVAIVFH